MKVRVIREFIDRYTTQCHEVGEELDITAGRLAEIQSVGQFVEVVQDESRQAAPENKNKPQKNARGRK